MQNLKQSKTKKAYSLLEVIVSLAIVSVAIVTLINFLVISLRLNVISLARSVIREELNSISTLVSRDIRNADLVLNCGNTSELAVSSECSFVSRGNIFRWQMCVESDLVDRICKYQLNADLEPISTEFASISNAKINDFSFSRGFTGIENNSSINIILLISADHINDTLNINNLFRETSVSTRNYY